MAGDELVLLNKRREGVVASRLAAAASEKRRSGKSEQGVRPDAGYRAG